MKKLNFLQKLLINVLLFGGTCFNVFALPSLSSDGGLKWVEPSNPDYWFKVGGRLQLDEVIFTGSFRDKKSNFPNGANIRRVFAEFQGGIGKDFEYQLNLSFKAAVVDFDRAFIDYKGLASHTFIRVGQFKPLLSLEYYSSDLNYLFLEVSLASSTFFVNIDKALGILGSTAIHDLFTCSAIVYQPRQLNTLTSPRVDSINNYWKAAKSDRLGEALRITYSPIHSAGQVFHLGVIGRHQSLNHSYAGMEVVQIDLFSTKPEAMARNTSSLINTTNNIRASSYHHAVAETAAILGPVTLMGEYHKVKVLRVPRLNHRDVGNVDFRGWYAQGGYVLTGESRTYDFENGTMGSVAPRSSCGALEALVRFSSVNLIDKNVYGGREHNTTLGLNWFVNDNVRLSFNYIRAILHPGIPDSFRFTVFPEKIKLNIFATRFQVRF